MVNLKPQDRELSTSLSSQESRPSVITRIPCVVDNVKEKSLSGCQGKQLRNMYGYSNIVNVAAAVHVCVFYGCMTLDTF